MKYDNILQTIGETPSVRLNHFRDHLARDLWVKVESFNPAAHRRTAEEIWADFGGGLDAIVATTGTGGTNSGAGRR